MFPSKNQSGETYPRNLASDETFVVPDKFLSELLTKSMMVIMIMMTKMIMMIAMTLPHQQLSLTIIITTSCPWQSPSPPVVLDNHHHHQLSLTITITTSCPWHGGGNPLLLRRGTISWSGASRTPWKKGHLNDCDNDDAGDPDDDVVWGHFSKWPWWWLWWWKLWWPRFTQLSRRYGATAKSQWNTWVGWREVNLQYSSCMCLNNL